MRVGVAAAIVGTFVVLSLMAGCSVIIWGQNVVQADWTSRYVCQHSLRKLHEALSRYVAVHGRFPDTLGKLAEERLCDPDFLVCSGSLRPYE